MAASLGRVRKIPFVQDPWCDHIRSRSIIPRHQVALSSLLLMSLPSRLRRCRRNRMPLKQHALQKSRRYSSTQAQPLAVLQSLFQWKTAIGILGSYEIHVQHVWARDL